MPKQSNAAGSENVRWDLSCFYKDIDDPQIDADLKAYEKRAKAFMDEFKGHLSAKLGPALSEYGELSMLSDKIATYPYLRRSVAMDDARVKSRMAEIQTRMSRVDGEYLTFFSLEVIALDDAALAKLRASDAVVAKNWPWIQHARVYKPHIFSEPVESALTKRGPFGPGSWSEFFDEVEADLRFDWKDGKKTLTEMLHVLSDSTDADERAAALKTVNDGFEGHFVKYSAQTLWNVIGAKAVEDRERAFAHPMAASNTSNRVPDAVVEALHTAANGTGSSIAKRYYRLKAAHLGMKTLKWSDRNAKMPFGDATIVPYDEAVTTVVEAYRSFSPTLAGLVSETIAEKRIDAPGLPNREGGAYNMSVLLPDRKPRAFTFMNYLGSNRDVMTLAHELGHGVHGMLAEEAQGPLMFHAPMAYAETASVFGEMTTFNALKAKLQAKGDKKALLAFIMGKLDDMMNTVVRQISFSNFERKVHGAGKKLSPDELDAIWMDVTRAMYGPDGEVFTYKDMSHLWAYVSHFHRPFYVYAYAFGELLTQSLYAKREGLGDRFEPLYLDMLRAGSTKNASELLAPFGLDPADPAFWEAGLKVGMETLLQEAEAISAEIGVRP